jgi:outer membrane biosynthesis protein TonB
MADKHDQWADTLSANHSGWLTGFLAEEDKIDRRMMWRLGSWGVAATGAVVIAVLASQSQIQMRRDQFAGADMLNRQAQQIQFVAKETQNEAKRLASAIDTLSGDRDRLYTRMTSVEQGLDSVTGSIKRQAQSTAPTAAPKLVAPAKVEPPPAPAASVAAPAAPPPPAAEPPTISSAPATAPVASSAPVADKPSTNLPEVAAPASSTPPISAPLMAWKSMIAPPDSTVAKLSEPPSAPSTDATPAASETTASVQTASTEPTPAQIETVATPVARTEFGVDIGGANSVEGLRAIWRGMSRSKALAGLRPIMMVKERATGLGMQLRLVAGPLNDAAEAAKICAALTENKRSCETSTFDGQRLALKAEPVPAQVAPTPAPAAKPVVPRRRAAPKLQERTEQVPPPVEEPPAPPPKPQSSLSSFLGIRSGSAN